MKQTLKNIIAYVLLIAVAMTAVWLVKLREDDKQIREMTEINLGI